MQNKKTSLNKKIVTNIIPIKDLSFFLILLATFVIIVAFLIRILD